MAVYCTGSISHTEDTIHKLFRTQYVTYSMGRVVGVAAAGVALAGIALLAPVPIQAQGLLMLAGCLLFSCRAFPAALQAERALDNRKGALPVMETRFYEGCMEVQEGKVRKKFRYEQLEHIVQDKDYLYLFLGADAVVMVDRATLPQQEQQKLLDKLQEKSGKHWERPISLLTLNLRDIVQMYQNGKQRDRRALKARKKL